MQCASSKTTATKDRAMSLLARIDFSLWFAYSGLASITEYLPLLASEKNTKDTDY